MNLSAALRSQKSKRRRALKGQVAVSCDYQSTSVVVNAGAFSHAFDVKGQSRGTAQTADFAAYSLAALSMSNGIEFTLENPVSAQTADNIRNLTNIYDVWAIGRLAPLRVNLPNVKENQLPELPDPRAAGLVCLSGGIDSTYAAITGAQNGSVSSGMLIAGADYENAQTPAFKELRNRVEKLTDRIGISVEIVETDVRKHRLDWEMMHSLVLAACLTFRQTDYQQGHIGLDHAGYQELVLHPWGNNSVLPHYYSTAQFPITGVGRHQRRFDKLAAIAQHDAKLPAMLSVCYHDVSRGENCGSCTKCVGTRILFQTLGLDDSTAFRQRGDLVKHIKALKVPKKASFLRAVYVRISEFVEVVPNGNVRDALVQYKSELRRRIEKTAPSD